MPETQSVPTAYSATYVRSMRLNRLVCRLCRLAWLGGTDSVGVVLDKEYRKGVHWQETLRLRRVKLIEGGVKVPDFSRNVNAMILIL